jgi:hypothetical protein
MSSCACTREKEKSREKSNQVCLTGKVLKKNGVLERKRREKKKEKTT